VRPTVPLQGPRRHHAGRDPARRSRHGVDGRALAASVRAAACTRFAESAMSPVQHVHT